MSFLEKIQRTQVLVWLLLLLASSEQFEDRWITRSPDHRMFASSVYIRMSRATDKFCTGTLVDRKWVLTAARCMYQGTDKVVESDKSITVYAGLDDRSELTGTRVQKLTSTMVRLYRDNYHSLALIKLSREFNISTKHGVRLSSVTSYDVTNVEDTICSSGSYGVRPNQSTGIKVMEYDLRTCKCHEEMKKHYPKELVDKWVCGQSGEPCQGDFGLGVMCDGSLQAVNIGVVFFENEKSCKIVEEKQPGCNQGNSMGLYVDVCYYLDWLQTFIPSVDKARIACNSTPITTSHLRWLVCSVSLVLLFVLNK